jgi:hypothetical protein
MQPRRFRFQHRSTSEPDYVGWGVLFPNGAAFLMPDAAKIEGPGPTLFESMELVDAQFEITWLDET